MSGESGKPREVQRLEDDMDGAVAKRCFQCIAHPASGRREEAGPEASREAQLHDFVVPEPSGDYFTHVDPVLDSVVQRCR